MRNRRNRKLFAEIAAETYRVRRWRSWCARDCLQCTPRCFEAGSQGEMDT
jgi:hypothetical protein